MSNDNELPAGFGDPSGMSQKYEIWKFKNIKDGEVDEHILRVLPMMKSLLQLDDFGLYWALHYGWNGINDKDPSKKAYHPFLCIQEKNYGMITTECPACTYRNSFIEKIKATDPNSEMGKKLQAWKDDHGLDGKFRIPCINKQGQFGIFVAPYNFVKSLKEEMRQLRTQTYPGTTELIKPAGRKGVWFKFTRTGKASPTSDKAVVNRITQADGSEIKDIHRISDEQLMEAAGRIPDLKDLREQNRITVEQINALVALDKAGKGSPDPKEVDLILEVEKKKAAPVDDVDYTGGVATGESATPGESKKSVVVTPTETPKVEPAKVEAPKEEPKAPPAPENFDDLWT
jgi:hypothetical protein